MELFNRDDLIEKENVLEEAADKELDNRLAFRTRIIVDTQISWRYPKEKEFYFLVFPPLDALIKRHQSRLEKRQIPPERAKWAKHYINKTHEKLSKFGKDYFHQIFDSSLQSVEEEVDQICQLLLFKHHFRRL